MKAVRVITGRGVPLARSDVDTDQIIPSDWLKRVERTGFGEGLFSEWREGLRLRAQPGALRRRDDPRRRPELRHRLVARARGVGAAGLRLRRGRLAPLRRHLPQQQPEDGARAGRAPARRSSSGSGPRSRTIPHLEIVVDVEARRVAVPAHRHRRAVRARRLHAAPLARTASTTSASRCTHDDRDRRAYESHRARLDPPQSVSGAVRTSRRPGARPHVGESARVDVSCGGIRRIDQSCTPPSGRCRSSASTRIVPTGARTRRAAASSRHFQKQSTSTKPISRSQASCVSTGDELVRRVVVVGRRPSAARNSSCSAGGRRRDVLEVDEPSTRRELRRTPRRRARAGAPGTQWWIAKLETTTSNAPRSPAAARRDRARAISTRASPPKRSRARAQHLGREVEPDAAARGTRREHAARA